MGKADKIDCSKDEKLTQQSAKEECDINVIVERAKRGADVGKMMNGRQPMYGDFTQIPTDLRECMVTVTKARDAFMTLDAGIRFRFQNDPALMIDFLNDPNNREEAIKLGLVEAPKEPEVKPKVEPVVESVDSPKADVSGSKKAKAKPVDD